MNMNSFPFIETTFCCIWSHIFKHWTMTHYLSRDLAFLLSAESPSPPFHFRLITTLRAATSVCFLSKDNTRLWNPQSVFITRLCVNWSRMIFFMPAVAPLVGCHHLLVSHRQVCVWRTCLRTCMRHTSSPAGDPDNEFVSWSMLKPSSRMQHHTWFLTLFIFAQICSTHPCLGSPFYFYKGSN